MISAGQLFKWMLSVRRDREISLAFRASLLGEAGRPSLHGATVLAHLREYCHADTSTLAYAPDGTIDPIASAMLEGRRDVWNKIAFYLNVEERDLIQLDREYNQQMQDLARRREGLN